MRYCGRCHVHVLVDSTTAAEGPETTLGRGTGRGAVVAAATLAAEADGRTREEEQEDGREGHPETYITGQALNDYLKEIRTDQER